MQPEPTKRENASNMFHHLQKEHQLDCEKRLTAGEVTAADATTKTSNITSLIQKSFVSLFTRGTSLR